MIASRRFELLTHLGTSECLRICEDGNKFALHGGGTSPYFIDVPALLRDLRHSKGVAEQLANLLTTTDEYPPRSLLSIDTGGTYCAIALQYYLSDRYKLHLPLYRVEKSNSRPLPKGYVILIDDVLTSGSSILPVLDHYQFQSDVGCIAQVITVLNRQNGGGEKMLGDREIPYSAVFTLAEVLASSLLVKTHSL